MAAGVEDRGRSFAPGQAWHVEVGRHVQPGQRLEMQLLDGEIRVLDAPGHDRFEVGPLGQRREAEHLQQLVAVGRPASLPVIEGANIGERGVREACGLGAEVFREHEIGGAGNRRRRGSGGERRNEDGGDQERGQQQTGSFHEGRG